MTEQELLIIGAFCNNDNRKKDVEFNKHEIKRLGQKLLIEVSLKLQQSDVIKSVCGHHRVISVRYAYKCEKCGLLIEGK